MENNCVFETDEYIQSWNQPILSFVPKITYVDTYLMYQVEKEQDCQNGEE